MSDYQLCDPVAVRLRNAAEQGLKLAAAWTFLWLTSGEKAVAQSPSVRRGVRTIAVSPRPACRCTLELERVVSLTDENFDLSLRTNIFVGRDATGRFLAGGTRGTVGVFAPDGRLQFAVGRAGSGPGEFREPYALYFTRGDSVVVLDRAIRRVTVFDPKTMRVVRSFPLEGSSTNHVFALGGESLVVDGVFGGAGIGKSVHQLSATGAYVRSVSADTAIIGRQSFRMLNRAFDHAKAGFFSAPNYRYRIEEWNERMELIRVFERSADWFPPLSGEVILEPPNRRPMPAQLLGFASDTLRGILFTAIRLGARDWSPDPRLAKSGEIALADAALGAAGNRYVDTIFEAIRIDGRLLASTRVRGKFGSVSTARSADGPLFWSVRETPSGTEVLDVYKLVLSRP
ncbi:MAG: hypothetical protein KA154_06245 [Gemmatimonadaceae bacterium]|nr:hypothetical protein [Gemmatimonadaceae bacterium]MCC6432035.1 hypothetical protein [Gemmatimonadaceae bacterium]